MTVKCIIYILSAFLSYISFSQAAEYKLNYNPESYVLKKLEQHNTVFLGTRHKQPPILEFISDLIPKLKESGVTHIGLEIASDQQDNINKFINTGDGFSDIQIHQQIECPEYKNLFNVLRSLDPNN